MAQALAVPVGAPSAETGPLELASRPAPLSAGLVPRQRLVRRLIDARELPVALVIAPAGYGKTTVLSEWEACDGRPFAWVKLDAEDNDPLTLLSAIVLALDSVEPVGWDVREALASEGSDGTTVALRRLVRSMGRRERPAVLVLDDLQLIRSRESRQVVTAIWRACGAGLQLALASRRDDILPVARLRAHRNSVELRTDELAMTRSEASALLQLAGVDLPPEQVLTLVRRTEGWPAGLQLAALSLREQGGERRRRRGVCRRRPLRDRVRPRGAPRGSPACAARVRHEDAPCSTRCRRRFATPLLARNDSADMLARLARANVMLRPLDRRDTSYRYHGLFGAVLRAELRRREPEHEPVLHMRASAWYAANGDAARAIGHAIDGGDVERAGTLLWDSALQQVARGQHREIWAWLDRFSDKELANTPLLALVAAATSLAQGDLYEAGRWTTLARSIPDRSDVVQAGVAVMQAAIGRRGLTQMAADASRARELLGGAAPGVRSACFSAVSHVTSRAMQTRHGTCSRKAPTSPPCRPRWYRPSASPSSRCSRQATTTSSERPCSRAGPRTDRPLRPRRVPDRRVGPGGVRRAARAVRAGGRRGP